MYCVKLSLYSTAMQSFRVGALCWSRPPTPKFRVGDNNMLVSKNEKICITPDAKPKICVTPNAKPKRKSVSYRLRLVPNAKFVVGHVDFIFLWVVFIRVGSRFSVEYGLYSQCISWFDNTALKSLKWNISKILYTFEIYFMNLGHQHKVSPYL